MRVMVFVKASVDGGPAAPPSAEAFAEMDRFTDELAAAGVLVAAAGLKNDALARRVLLDGDRRIVTDGPFTETRELVAGFSIWQVRDIDEAMAWARRMPGAGTCRSEIEIRPFYEVEDLADYLTPEELATPRSGERGRLGVA